MKETVLDNPAWEALSSQHAGFAQGTNNARRYRPGILPFTGCKDGSKGNMLELDPFITAGESFYIIGDDVSSIPKDWTIEHELPCSQMVLKNGVAMNTENARRSIVQLGEADANEMYGLINIVQPGYYNKDTRLLGTYFGIKQDDKLVAMAGERMRLDGYSELSAICTLPGYTGRGYAQQLIAQLCNMHAANKIVSFLHVALSNHRAIGLYEHMGFEQRRTIVFRKMKKR